MTTGKALDANTSGRSGWNQPRTCRSGASKWSSDGTSGPAHAPVVMTSAPASYEPRVVLTRTVSPEASHSSTASRARTSAPRSNATVTYATMHRSDMRNPPSGWYTDIHSAGNRQPGKRRAISSLLRVSCVRSCSMQDAREPLNTGPSGLPVSTEPVMCRSFSPAADSSSRQRS